MKTIAKNTKAFKNAVMYAQGIKRFDLDNGFSGKFVTTIDAVSLEMGKLVRMMDHYRLRVHSNLWYEFTVA